MEKWKDEIIDSLQGMERAKAPADTFLKIQEKINSEKTPKGKQWMAVAASIVLVLCANVLFISNYTSSPIISENQTEAYLSIISNFNLYE